MKELFEKDSPFKPKVEPSGNVKGGGRPKAAPQAKGSNINETLIEELEDYYDGVE
jgi:hypothetical protein